MKCQLKYRWVKLPRACLPQGKGVLGQWARLAARAAYRKGVGRYCGFENSVDPGMWAGGVVGLKSILGIKSRKATLEALELLQELGYISYSLNSGTKKLEYTLLDWVTVCTGESCLGQGVYAYEGQGFLCLPRSIPDRLVARHHIFEEADALLDLWCHTVWQEPRNIFSHRAPTVQFGSLGAVLTLETLGRRWAGKRPRYGGFSKNTRMPSLCTVCPAPMAAWCSTPSTLRRALPRAWGSHCPPRRNLRAQSKDCVFARATRTLPETTICGSTRWSSGTARRCWASRAKTAALHFQPLYYARILLRVGIVRIVSWTARKKEYTKSRFSLFVRSRLFLIWKGRYPMKTKKDSRNSTTQSQALLALLTAQGLLEDNSIQDETRRKAQQERLQKLYHNTQTLLAHYRDIAWALECFPEAVAQELDQPFDKLDTLLDRMDAEAGMGNRKLESRVESLRKSRLLLDRINEALTVLKKKPGNGPRLYELIYLTYIVPEKLSHTDLLFRLDLSSRQYYRLREEAISIISIRLWSVPEEELERLVEIVSLLHV